MSNHATIRRRSSAADEAAISRLSEIFKALSDPTRLRLITALTRRELCVGELVAAVGLSESAVSHQLRTLRQLHLVRARKAGRQVFYALADEHIEELLRFGLDHARHD